MLRGLFIGIDRYAAPINRLACAVPDARALGSLFQDNADGKIVSLLDADATAARIEAALGDLAAADADDLVVITFSGHGTVDHYLVPVDADAADLAGSCLSLDRLAELLDAIPAKHLLVILDCCFAGGFGGARVFAPTTTRAPLEDRGPLTRLARGSGRIVVTASGAGEPALETQRYGHGLLSYHLLAGLQGFAGYADADQLPLLALLDHVTTGVVDSARLLAEVQTPTVYGSTEGAPTLQRLVPGAHYAAAFPERTLPPATPDWSSLGSYGLDDDAIARWSQAMPGLNDLQLQAINTYGVLGGKSLLVVAPTASGKTMIGELAAIQQVAHGGRTVMVLPLRALVNDKYAYFTELYGDRYTIVRATGEYADEIGAIYSGQYDIALLTYEKFLSMVTGSPWLLRGVSLVVVDEAQNIADPSRGSSLEFLLTLLRSGHSRGGSPQIIALSAVIGATHGLERWFDAGLLRTEQRPVPLRESVIDGNGQARHRMPDGSESGEAFITPAWGIGGQGSKTVVIPLVQRLVREGKKVIVFRAMKAKTVGTGLYLAFALDLPAATSVLEQLPDGDLSASSSSLRQALQGGVGFHNADLSPGERSALESRFRDPDSDLKVIVATTTLAMGINTPAEAVIIAGLVHPGPEPSPYSVAEYKNMVGRAGRLGHTDAGESYIIATGQPPPAEAWHHYVLGASEGVTSHFLDAATDPQTLILRSLVALGGSVNETALIALLENSFAVWQRIDRGGAGWDTDALRRDVQTLIAADLVDQEPTGLLTVTELGRYAGESGLEVRSVTQVSSLLRFVRQPLSGPDVVTLAQVTVELDGVYLPVANRSRQEQARWPRVLQSMGVQHGLLSGLHVGGGNTLARAKRAAAALYFTSANPMNRIEAELMQHLPDRSSAGPIRAVAGRTRDVIDAVARIGQVRGATFVDESEIEGLGIRLEIGLPAELSDLATLVGNTLTRANYLALLDAYLVSVNNIQSAPVETL